MRSITKEEGVLLEFGKKIRRRRIELEISQEALAEIAGVSRASISRIENGDGSRNFITVLKVMQALEMEYAEGIL